MPNLIVEDLVVARDLDRAAKAEISGGSVLRAPKIPWNKAGVGPFDPYPTEPFIGRTLPERSDRLESFSGWY